MIGAPLIRPCGLGHSVPGPSKGASTPSARRRCQCSDQATTGPSLTESHQVVGGTSLLPLHRQK
jgi:hypothetical protein